MLLCVAEVWVCWSVTLRALRGARVGPDRHYPPSYTPADFGEDMAAMFSGMLGGSDGSNPLGLDSVPLDGTADWSDLMSSLSGLMSTPGLATPSSFFPPSSTAAPSGGAATDAAATLASLFSGSTSLASLLGSASSAAPKLSLPKLPLSASGPFAALLRPPGAAATRGAGAQQLLDAIRQADALFHTPVLDDLFGGGWNGWRWPVVVAAGPVAVPKWTRHSQPHDCQGVEPRWWSTGWLICTALRCRHRAWKVPKRRPRAAQPDLAGGRGG